MDFIQKRKEERDKFGLKLRGKNDIHPNNAKIRSRAAVEFGKMAWEAFSLRWIEKDF